MNTINILVLEDDDYQANILKKALSGLYLNNVIISKSVDEAQKVYHSEIIDFMIIDIMIGKSMGGIDFVRSLSKNKHRVAPFLFLTGHYDRIVFESAKVTHPYGYLLKPYNSLELEYNIELAIEKYHLNISIENEHFEKGLVHFLLKRNSIFYKVLPDDISFVEVEGRYCQIYALSNKFIIQKTLQDFQKKLPKFFVRVHRSFVVNLKKIKEVHIKDNLIVLEDNSSLSLGRVYKNDFYDRYQIFV
jgi:DNA-binding LytR/AlgR family response regulator